MDVTEFLAHDDKAYKQWIKAMSTVVHAFDEIAASPSIEHTMRWVHVICYCVRSC